MDLFPITCIPPSLPPEDVDVSLEAICRGADAHLFPPTTDGYTLMGCGARKEMFFKVYTVGNYMRKEDLIGLKEHEMKGALVNPEYNRIFRVVLESECTTEQFINELLEHMWSRLADIDRKMLSDSLRQDLLETLSFDELKQIQLKRLGENFVFKTEQVVILIQGDILQVEALGQTAEVKSRNITTAFCKLYCGDSPIVSSKLRSETLKGIQILQSSKPRRLAKPGKENNEILLGKVPSTSEDSDRVGPIEFVFGGGTPMTDPATNITFPNTINGLTLLGCGVRIKYAFVKVYSFGLYMNPSVFADPTANVMDILLNPHCHKLVRLVLNRDLTSEQYINAIMEALTPRMHGQDMDKLEQLRTQSPPGMLLNRTEIYISIEGENFSMQLNDESRRVVRLKSEVLTRALCDLYYGENPVSPAKKASILEGISKLDFSTEESDGDENKLRQIKPITKVGKEPVTGIPFPQRLHEKMLLGIGVRIKFVFVKVYAVGLYMDPRDFQALDEKSISKVLLDPTYSKLIRVVFNRDLSSEQYIGGMLESLTPRMHGEDMDKLELLRSRNKPGVLKDRTEILISVEEEKLSLQVQGMEDVNEVSSIVLTRAVCDTYFGEDPVSPTLREHIFQNVVSMEELPPLEASDSSENQREVEQNTSVETQKEKPSSSAMRLVSDAQQQAFIINVICVLLFISFCIIAFFCLNLHLKVDMLYNLDASGFIQEHKHISSFKRNFNFLN